jgi:hypothetical protein
MAWWSGATLVDPTLREMDQEHVVRMLRPQDPPEQQLTEEGVTVAMKQRRGGAPTSMRQLQGGPWCRAMLRDLHTSTRRM